jgi:hypothetical protein
MTEASLAIARKVILCCGLLTGALLFLYPHWRGSFRGIIEHEYEYDLGRGFITAPPIPDPRQIARLTGLESAATDIVEVVQMINLVNAKYHVHRVRQLTEVALALLFTFGVMRVLRKPAGD